VFTCFVLTFFQRISFIGFLSSRLCNMLQNWFWINWKDIQKWKHLKDGHNIKEIPLSSKFKDNIQYLVLFDGKKIMFLSKRFYSFYFWYNLRKTIFAYDSCLKMLYYAYQGKCLTYHYYLLNILQFGKQWLINVLKIW